MIIPKKLQEAFNQTVNRSRAIGVESQDGFDAMKDYLAQKFTAAYCRSESKEEMERLTKLWNCILNDEDEKVQPEEMVAVFSVLRSKN